MTRALVFGLLGFLLLTVLGPLLRLLGIDLAGVDVAAIIVLHVSMSERRPIFGQGTGWRLFSGGLEVSSVVLALTLGYLTDLLGGGPRGLHAFSIGLLYLVARAASRQVSLVGGLSQSFVTFAASLLVSIVGLLLRWALGVPPGAGLITPVLGQAVLTAAAAPLLMRLLRWIEQKLSREPTERGTLHVG